jgi:CheY-like chemotaxis protein
METPDRVRPKVLLVDDDAANLRTFERAFRGEFEIASARSGEAALALLAGGPYDVALIDYSMPGMDGLQLADRIARAHPDVPRIVVTGYGDLPELLAAEERGLVLAVVMKPWDRSELRRTVGRAVRLRAPAARS